MVNRPRGPRLEWVDSHDYHNLPLAAIPGHWVTFTVPARYFPDYPQANRIDEKTYLSSGIAWMYYRYHIRRPIFDLLTEIVEALPLQLSGNCETRWNHWMSPGSLASGLGVRSVAKRNLTLDVHLGWTPAVRNSERLSVYIGAVRFQLRSEFNVFYNPGYLLEHLDLNVGLRHGQFADPRNLFTGECFSEISDRLRHRKPISSGVVF